MVTPDKPELSNGYTRIASAILENLATVRLSGREWNVLMVIFRQTYGWNRKEARISLTQFASFTGLPAAKVCGVLKSLESKGIVCIGRESITHVYSFQKYLTRWRTNLRMKPCRATQTIPENGSTGTPENGSTSTPLEGSTTIPENGNPGIYMIKDISKYTHKRKSAKPPAPGVHELITAYTEAYEEQYHRKPIVNWGQWGRELKLWLVDHDVEYLAKVIDRFMQSNDPWIVSCAHSLGALKARINALMSELDEQTADEFDLEESVRVTNERYAEEQEFKAAAAERRSRASGVGVGDDEQGCTA